MQNDREKELWKVFAEVQGCEPNKEDCSFEKCHSWANCERLIDALSALGQGECKCWHFDNGEKGNCDNCGKPLKEK